MRRERISRTFLALLLVMALLAAAPGLVAQDGDKGLAAFKAYLKKVHAKKKWSEGPSPLTSAAIRSAYGADQKFYYVFSAPPLPPGANLPEVIKIYEAKAKDYRDNYVSVTVRVDATGKVIPLSKPADYNQGLAAVKNDDDARTAAAAVLSLFGSDKVSPGLVKATEVKATGAAEGWQCVVDRANEFQGSVSFDKEGRVIGVSKVYFGPVPP